MLLAQISSLLDLIEALFLTDSHCSHRVLHHHHLLPRSQIENDDVNEVDNVLHSVLEVHREQVNSGLRAVVGLSGHLLRADEAIVQQRQHRLRFNPPLRSDRSADLLGQHADVRDLLLVQLLVLDQRANNARAHALLPRLSLTRPAKPDLDERCDRVLHDQPHHSFVVHSVPNVNVRNIGQAGDSRIQIDDICVLTIICHITRDSLQVYFQIVQNTFMSVVFPLPAIPITIQHTGWSGVGSLISDIHQNYWSIIFWNGKEACST